MISECKCVIFTISACKFVIFMTSVYMILTATLFYFFYIEDQIASFNMYHLRSISDQTAILKSWESCLFSLRIFNAIKLCLLLLQFITTNVANEKLKKQFTKPIIFFYFSSFGQSQFSEIRNWLQISYLFRAPAPHSILDLKRILPLSQNSLIRRRHNN